MSVLKRFFLFNALVFAFLFCGAQHSFQKIFTAGWRANGIGVSQEGNAYVVAGNIEPGTLYHDVFMVKCDSVGNLIWGKHYGGTQEDEISCQTKTDDGGYVVAGHSASFSGGDAMFAMKIDSNGSVVWSNKYATNFSYSEATSIIQTFDGGYMLLGYVQGVGLNHYDVHLLKLDSAGEIEWAKTYGGQYADYGSCIVQTSDSCYAVCGQTVSFGPPGDNAFIFKITNSGLIIWAKTFGSVYPDRARSLIKTSDEGLLILCQSDYKSGVYLIKLDSDGNVQRNSSYHSLGTSYGSSLIETGDKGFIISGDMDIYNTTDKDAFLSKLDSAGNWLWTKKYGVASQTELGNYVEQTADKGYVLAGYSGGYNALYLIKTDTLGNSGCFETSVSCTVDTGLSEFPMLLATDTISAKLPISFTVSNVGSAYDRCLLTNQNDLSDVNYLLYPNPASNSITIENNKYYYNANVRITSAEGALLKIFTGLCGETIELQVADLPNGVYFICIEQGNEFSVMRKLIISD